jgi:NitT/TauT family transport system permease protein
MALLGAVLGEYVGGTEGLGWLIQNAAGLFQTTRVFSSLVVLVALVVLLSAVLNAAEARLLHWRPVDRAW